MKPFINNIPDYAYRYNYVVYSVASDGTNWFYGAYDELNEATRVAVEICGMVANVTQDKCTY